jgi:phosphopantothenoylcysteine synthetase/decarboxylase
MRILITAGPTREAVDPVRYFTNRSSGRMGYALAIAAREAGHVVTLVSGPTILPHPPGVNFVPVETAQHMYDAVAGVIKAHDVAIFAAAVADYRAQRIAPEKIKKTEDSLTLVLERTPDILGSARVKFGFNGYLVGFAAETQNVVAEGHVKLQRKACDMIAANDVSRAGTGFDSEENEITLCLPGGISKPLPRGKKTDLARQIIRFIEERVSAQSPTT